MAKLEIVLRVGHQGPQEVDTADGLTSGYLVEAMVDEKTSGKWVMVRRVVPVDLMALHSSPETLLEQECRLSAVDAVRLLLEQLAPLRSSDGQEEAAQTDA